MDPSVVKQIALSILVARHIIVANAQGSLVDMVLNLLRNNFSRTSSDYGMAESKFWVAKFSCRPWEVFEQGHTYGNIQHFNHLLAIR